MFWGADNIRLLCLMTAAVLVERLLADGHQRIPAHSESFKVLGLGVKPFLPDLHPPEIP